MQKAHSRILWVFLVYTSQVFVLKHRNRRDFGDCGFNNCQLQHFVFRSFKEILAMFFQNKSFVSATVTVWIIFRYCSMQWLNVNVGRWGCSQLQVEIYAHNKRRIGVAKNRQSELATFPLFKEHIYILLPAFQTTYESPVGLECRVSWPSVKSRRP